jgi:hypothetical protein
MKKLKKCTEEGLGTRAHSPTHSHIPHLMLMRSDLPCTLWCGGSGMVWGVPVVVVGWLWC